MTKAPYEQDAGGYMGDWSRGAPLGRRSAPFGTLTGRKLHLRRVRLDSGGYDSGGAYWGIGNPLYCAYAADGNGNSLYLRARDRDHAKAQILSGEPDVTFFR